jgi:hypothetical protein
LNVRLTELSAPNGVSFGKQSLLAEARVLQAFFAVLAFVAASVHLLVSPKRRSEPVTVVGTYLLYLLFIYVGLMGLFTAYYHIFRPIETSASIGWSTSPYEYEVGMADLTVGVLGVLCLAFRNGFWLATAIADAVWLLGDAVGHIRQMVVHNNHAENNAGIFLIFELLMPTLILGLVIFYRRLSLDRGMP